MLLNFVRLNFKEESKELAESLNGYLNVYKLLMTSSLEVLDIYNNIEKSKVCDTKGCK